MSLSEKPEKATGSKAGLEPDYQAMALGQLQSETLHLWFVSEDPVQERRCRLERFAVDVTRRDGNPDFLEDAAKAARDVSLTAKCVP